jgi:hypothetical protein
MAGIGSRTGISGSSSSGRPSSFVVIIVVISGIAATIIVIILVLITTNKCLGSIACNHFGRALLIGLFGVFQYCQGGRGVGMGEPLRFDPTMQ